MKTILRIFELFRVNHSINLLKAIHIYRSEKEFDRRVKC
jgi:hypothetical protein